ncbi:FKBP-type peptidyl-prolyl cis-trans isomerase [Pokkaliibacter sp. MBI-7]|uniref:FKBP-type peptidyl-prolyl cis-trans isomerase n=1 Tax=Pokkaliibacter sp. MBI-7 TaxID=3040600 RepID=UPI00244CABC3|nr:FKBP-type peptidyl-prolyl cis-trans isomerase [Pokkaliibacter sp. MBI-7]MDH2434054.1 FKBP-type peptidyl-prolyl cis-trans isomerase [Pokkaliibacter sp. MBI-7]
MKKRLLAIALSMVVAAPVLAADAVKLDNDSAKLSYSFGLVLGEQLSSRVDTLDYDAFIAGVKAIYDKTEPAMNQEQVAETIKSFQQKKMDEMLADAKKKSDDFLAANAKKDGVKSTKSGLQYKIISEGKGPKPKSTDQVRVNYRGTLIDGTEFDSSYARKEPAEFPLDAVIPGWTEGLQLMPVGSKFELYIPPELGYGPGGAGSIPPNATLVFEVELLDILKPDAKAEEKPAEPSKTGS